MRKLQRSTDTEYVVSFYSSSLFTNVPLDEIINIVPTIDIEAHKTFLLS